jgi:hypothetical protein
VVMLKYSLNDTSENAKTPKVIIPCNFRP